MSEEAQERRDQGQSEPRPGGLPKVVVDQDPKCLWLKGSKGRGDEDGKRSRMPRPKRPQGHDKCQRGSK